MIPFAQIDAFASRPFEGNQACIMPLQNFLYDSALQNVAAENNVAETAFIVSAGPGRWYLRWFTPTMEVPLCGHATLAAAHYIYTHQGFAGEEIAFETRQSGILTVKKLQDGRLEMDFPAPSVSEIRISDEITTALGARPIRAWAGPFYAAEFATVSEVLALKPDLRALKTLGPGKSGAESGPDWSDGNFGCFARGGPKDLKNIEITSRFFAPGSGIDEDPATGSWHCMLSRLLGPQAGENIQCYQAYPGRGAYLEIALQGDRVKLRGQAVTVITGQFTSDF